MTFAGQNFGARNLGRIKKTLAYSMIQTVAVGLTVGLVELILIDPLSRLYLDATDPMLEEVVAIVKDVASLLLPTYFLCAIMDVCNGTLKGLGYSLLPMMLCLFSICGLRLFWVNFIFPLERFHTPRGLMTCYPITWSVAILLMVVAIIFALRRAARLIREQGEADK
jgi:Na+-driven multidrug efflux pump